MSFVVWMISFLSFVKQKLHTIENFLQMQIRHRKTASYSYLLPCTSDIDSTSKEGDRWKLEESPVWKVILCFNRHCIVLLKCSFLNVQKSQLICIRTKIFITASMDRIQYSSKVHPNYLQKETISNKKVFLLKTFSESHDSFKFQWVKELYKKSYVHGQLLLGDGNRPA